MAKILKRDVDAAAARLCSAERMYGPNDMAITTAWGRFNDLRCQWETQTGRGYHRALPTVPYVEVDMEHQAGESPITISRSVRVF